MNPIKNLHQGQNKVIVSMGYDNTTDNIMLTPSHDATLPDPSIVDIAISSLALASIDAQSITAVPNQTPYIVGTCAIDVSVTRINNGGSGSTFVPNITTNITLVPGHGATLPDPLAIGTIVDTMNTQIITNKTIKTTVDLQLRVETNLLVM